MNELVYAAVGQMMAAKADCNSRDEMMAAIQMFLMLTITAWAGIISEELADTPEEGRKISERLFKAFDDAISEAQSYNARRN